MIVRFGKYLLKIVGSKYISKAARWGFVSVLCLVGPGPIIAVVGIEGLVITGVITQSGIIEYASSKVIRKL